MHPLAVLALVPLALACAGSPPSVVVLPRLLPRWEAPPPAADDIVRVELDRLGDGWGMTPVYRLDLRRDGQSTYTGGPHEPRTGQWLVPLDSVMFAALAEALVRGEFFHFDPRPVNPPGCVDAVRLEVAITLRSGQVHRIHNECSSTELAAVAAQIDAAVPQVAWLPTPLHAVPPN